MASRTSVKDVWRREHMYSAFLLLFALLGSSRGARTLQQAAPCGEIIPDSDIPGQNLPGFPVITADFQACLDICVETDTCTAAIWFTNNGGCYLKAVDVDDVQPVARAGFTSYLVCEDDPSAPAPGPEPGTEVCGEFIADVDIPGPNLPGSPTIEANPEACRDVCVTTDTCNAAIFVPNASGSGGCYLKSVNVDNVVPNPWPGLTSFLANCDDVEPPTPGTGTSECGEFLPDVDIPGANLPGSGTFTADPQACVDLCETTDTCNAVARVPGGACFLKSVDLDTVESVPSVGLTSFLICDEPPMNPGCDVFIQDVDIPGANLPGSGVITASNEECLSQCRASAPCNATVRIPSGACFLKEVDFDAVQTTPVAGRVGYLDCNPPIPDESWRELKPLPVAIGEVSSAVLQGANGKDYLITVGEHSSGDPKNGVTLIYDIEQDTWFEGGARPLVGNHHNAEVINNQLYLIGGLGDSSGGEIQIGTLTGGTPGNPLTMTWTQGADSPLDTGSANSAVIGGLVYLCGGIVGGGTIPDCNVYDPSIDTWLPPAQAPPDMPAGRNHAAACTDGSKLYAFGGRIGGNAPGQGFDDTQIYTPGSGWTTGTPLPFGRGGMGRCICTGGKCYVFGGEVPGSTAPSITDKINTKRTVFSTDIYDIASDSWSFGPDMPEGLHGIFPVLHNGKIYIAGGGTVFANSQSTFVFEFTL